ncbi:sugar diacid recognition domain-containing protein [Virgibacillus halophilus]|uniref:Sugar diacid recognition domain-containing protein n=1 Tax=Tigheibacillus halophilus TaxID=361280 RepID=A0ABU5C2P9_9BACI|nr:sugar diacid recognition domain-containing protein [Virgibacillus halophilus]
MLQDISQNLAESIGAIINKEIIITDEHAVIIGASDETRIGSLHEASIRIMQTGKPNRDNNDIAKLSGTREGFCLPVKLQSKTIGSVGVTGKREEVKYYCYLIKEYLENLLYQEIYLKSVQMRDQHITDLVIDIASFNQTIMEESILLSRAEEMGYNLTLPHYAVIVACGNAKQHISSRNKLPEKTLDISMELKIQTLHIKLQFILADYFSHPNTIIASLSDNKFVIFHPVEVLQYQLHQDSLAELKEKCKGVMNEFSKLDITTYIGVGGEGSNAEGLKQTYEEANKALKLGDESADNIYFYDDFLLEDAIDRLPPGFYETVCRISPIPPGTA